MNLNRLTWQEKDFNNDIVSGKMTVVNDMIKVTGRVKSLGYTKMMFWAAESPEVKLSFSGYGLPYANPDMAYENTTNSGIVELDNLGNFEFLLKYPNAYYVGLGSLYIPPHVNLKLFSNNEPDNKVISLKIDEGIPFRTLTYPSPPSKNPRQDPMFYMSYWQGARTQEEILKAKAYPDQNMMPDNFWGTAPPQ